MTFMVRVWQEKELSIRSLMLSPSPIAFPKMFLDISETLKVQLPVKV